MKKLFVVIAVIIMVLTTSGIAFAGDPVSMGPGPAPDSGDGDPDDYLQYGPNGSVNGIGPAPNAGLGIHDGPGWPEE